VILVAAVFLSALVALLRGGRLARLADLRIERGWLALAAVALQYPLVFDMLGKADVLGVPVSFLVMGCSYALLFWVLWANRRLPGVPLVGLGMACNLLVMALNGGWMPIAPEALARLGYVPPAEAAASRAKVWGAKDALLSRAATRLWWLSDVFVLAAPFPVPAAFSVGDIVVAVGTYWLLQQVLLGRWDRTAAAGGEAG